MAALPEAVAAAAKIGNARFLVTGDPDSPEFRPDYLPLMRAIAAGEPVGVRADAAPVEPAPDWPPCPYRDTSCSCPRRKCLHRTYGPAFGTAEPEAMADGSTATVWRVTVDACWRCVG